MWRQSLSQVNSVLYEVISCYLEREVWDGRILSKQCTLTQFSHEDHVQPSQFTSGYFPLKTAHMNNYQNFITVVLKTTACLSQIFWVVYGRNCPGGHCVRWLLSRSSQWGGVKFLVGRGGRRARGNMFVGIGCVEASCEQGDKSWGNCTLNLRQSCHFTPWKTLNFTLRYRKTEYTNLW